jgi:hypothetical protein
MGAVTSAPVPLTRRLAAEFLGSAFLAAIVIGSGIAAQRLSPGNTGLELLENDLDLSYTPPLGSPWDAVQAGAQAWTCHPTAQTADETRKVRR